MGNVGGIERLSKRLDQIESEKNSLEKVIETQQERLLTESQNTQKLLGVLAARVMAQGWLDSWMEQIHTDEAWFKPACTYTEGQPEYTMIVNETSGLPPSDNIQRGVLLQSGGPLKPVSLDSVVYFRRYADDLAKLALTGLLDWLTYMEFVGIQRVYLYDSYDPGEPDECLRNEPAIRALISNGFVVYLDASSHMTPWSADKQVECYVHAKKHFGHLTTWRVHMDADEYPVVRDYKGVVLGAGSFAAFVNLTMTADQSTGLIWLNNYVCGGFDLHPDALPRFARYPLCTKEPTVPANKKYVLKLAESASFSVHTAELVSGIDVEGVDVLARDQTLLMQHYWGPRCHPLDALDRYDDKLALYYFLKPPEVLGAMNEIRKCFMRATGYTKGEASR